MSNDNAAMKSLRALAAASVVILVGVLTSASLPAAVVQKGNSLSSQPASASGPSAQAPSMQASSMQGSSAHALGTFEVKNTPQEDKPAIPTLGRFMLDKTFHGDLEGTSQGVMLGASTDVKGSAGYVAVERVTGTLRTSAGLRHGSFTLQHSGTMSHGNFELNVSVVPDSGTGQLIGLAGKMKINIADGKHSYDFDYTLP